MALVIFENTELNLIEDSNNDFLISSKDVAKGYGCSSASIRNHLKNHNEELKEGKHWIKKDVLTKGGVQSITHWTKKGIVRLGFFIKSERAKKFRDWAEDYIVSQKSLPNKIDIDAVPRSQVDEILEASNKLFEEFEKQKLELEDLKKQLNRKESETPFEKKIKEMFPNIKDSVHHHVILSYMKSFENKANWKAPKFENAFAVFREDWMILLNVALEYLEEARNPKRVQQLTYKGGNLV